MPKRASTSPVGRATPHEQRKARRSNNASPPARAVHLSDSDLPKAYCYVELGFHCVTWLGAMSIVCAHCVTLLGAMSIVCAHCVTLLGAMSIVCAHCVTLLGAMSIVCAHCVTLLGAMSIIRAHCAACRFSAETKGICCNVRKTRPPVHPSPPVYLLSLMSFEDVDYKHFLDNTHFYNNAFQMTSFGCNQRKLPGWIPTFTVHGQVCHRIGSIHSPDDQLKCLQIYFIDSHETQVQLRLTPGTLRHNIIHHRLTEMFHEVNNHVSNLKHALEYLHDLDSPELRVVIHEDKRPANQHPRRYNALAGGEIGILIPNEPNAVSDIVLHQRDGHLQHISELQRSYDSLQYPLLFLPYRGDGYSICLLSDGGRKITQMQYYAYHIMYRSNNRLLLCRRLFQQFLVDAYCKIETELLHYMRRSQKALCTVSYQYFRDSLLAGDGDGDARNIGQRVILPWSFTGGPRNMHERQQDSITYVRPYGRPHLFITTTTNQKWPEISGNLLPHQTATDRPDIVVRVFHLKFKKLMDILKKEHSWKFLLGSML